MMFVLLLFYSLVIAGEAEGYPEATIEAHHLGDTIRDAMHDILVRHTAVYDARIAELESQIQTQNKRINVLENRDKLQTLTIDDLSKKLDALTNRENGHRENESTSGVQDDPGHKSKLLSEELDKTRPSLHNLTRRTGKPARVSRSPIRQSTPEYVAFTAYLDHDVSHMADGHVVKFNKVHLNEGNGYNTFTGAFTVPTSGVYMFSFNYNSHYRQTILELLIDGAQKAAAIASPVTNHEAMGGQTVVVRVSAGQSVTIEQKIMSDGELYVGPITDYATFTGVLLH